MSERDAVNPTTQVVNEPPQQSGGIRIRNVTGILSSSPEEYLDILRSFRKVDDPPSQQAKEMSGNKIGIAAKTKGDEAIMGETDFILPEKVLPKGWEKGPVKLGDGFLLVRPLLKEAVYVRGRSSSPIPIGEIVEEILSAPQAVTISPPYKQEWQIIEGSVDALPANNNLLQFPKPQTQAAVAPDQHIGGENVVSLDEARRRSPFFKPPTDADLKKPAA